GGEAGEVGVPGVRVHEVDAAQSSDHRQVGRHGEQGRVGPSSNQGRVRPVCVGTLPVGAETVHVDIDGRGESAQVTGEVLHVDAGTPVDLGRVLTAQQGNTHRATLSP